jgi:hypothetical protein
MLITEKSMRSFEYLSAKAVLRQIENGVIEVTHYGVLSEPSIVWMGPRIFSATIEAPALVVRMDTAVVAVSSIPDFPIKRPGIHLPVAAIVVQTEHLEMLTNYSHRMALAGAMRAVFSTSQVGLAYQWAQAHALAELSVLPQSQNCKQSSWGSAP